MTEMVLVPREPTKAMVKAGRDEAQSAVAHYVPWNEVAASVWTAMLSAVPPASVGREEIARIIEERVFADVGRIVRGESYV